MRYAVIIASLALFLLSMPVLASEGDGEIVLINHNVSGLGGDLEIGYLAGGFTCKVTVVNNDDIVDVEVFQARNFGRWEWDEDAGTILGPGESLIYWLNSTYPSTTRHMVYMLIVFNETYVNDMVDIEMEIIIEAKDPDGKPFPREDLLDKDKVWDKYLECIDSGDDDWIVIPNIVKIMGLIICLPILLLIVVIVVIVIIIRNNRRKPKCYDSQS